MTFCESIVSAPNSGSTTTVLSVVSFEEKGGLQRLIGLLAKHCRHLTVATDRGSDVKFRNYEHYYWVLVTLVDRSKPFGVAMSTGRYPRKSKIPLISINMLWAPFVPWLCTLPLVLRKTMNTTTILIIRKFQYVPNISPGLDASTTSLPQQQTWKT